MTELPIQQALLDAIDVLEQLRIPYVIMGGFAVRSWGVPRPTYDADVAVAVDETRMGELLSALEQAGFRVDERYKSGAREVVGGLTKIKVIRLREESLWEVDLFLIRGAFLQTALSRGCPRTLEGRTVQVMTPEDIILLKLLAFRRKDQLDVEEIIKIATNLDRVYLADWANTLGLSGRLREFLP